MAKALEWGWQDGATYAWVLGLHYYAERDEDGWPPCCMVNNQDIWTGPHCETRALAEHAMQAHFNAEIARWATPES